MDVRLFTFLVRQPSARLQPRLQFCGVSKRALAFLLANVMFWQPLWAQAAEGVMVSGGNTSVGQAGNGVPIVNIAAPNGSGLSHNQFSDYNVGQQGLILNNATSRTQQTQLGGIIVGNPNLQGTAASIILNEVNGANSSQLRGYTEVAGQSAHVIVANPHGITCNGCGFINTPQVTLTTGTPVIDNGQLTRYQVEQGSVAIEGAGLNASNVDRFEIITRSAQINAGLQAKRLDIVAGRNDVDARTLAATARAEEGGAKPTLAIDSSALGGMYAGAIKLVGTEAGVGVKLDGQMAASGGDIQLDANGQLTLNQASASGAVTVRAAGVDLQGPVHGASRVEVLSSAEVVNRQALTAGGKLQVQAAGTLSNLGVIESGVNTDGSRNTQGDIDLAAGALVNTGKSIVASRDLNADIRGSLDNRGGTLSAAQDLRSHVGVLDNSAQGRVLAGRDQTVQAASLINDQGGQVVATRAQQITATRVSNRAGQLAAGERQAIAAQQVDNDSGRISAGRELAVTASSALDNRAGTLAADRELRLQAGSLVNRDGGRIASTGQLDVQAGSLDQRGGGQLHADQALSLDLRGGHLENSDGGLISSPGTLRLLGLGSVGNRAGEISSAQGYQLATRQLDNRGGKLLSGADLQLAIVEQLNNGAGLIAAQGLALTAAELLNGQGTLQARGTLAAQVKGRFDNRGGLTSAVLAADVQALALDNRGARMTSQQSLSLSSASLDNSEGGRLDADQALTLDLLHGHWNNAGGRLHSAGALVLRNLASVDNRHGEMHASSGFTFAADSLDNQDGSLSSKGALILRIAAVLDNSRALISAEQLDLSAGDVLNLDGRVQARQGLTLSVQGALDNQRGNLGGQTLDAHLGRLDNRAGRVQTDAGLTLTSAAVLDNRSGAVIAGQSANIDSGDLDNTGGQLYAADHLSLNAARLDNGTAARLHAGQRLQVSATQMHNAGQVFSGADLLLNLRGGLLDNQGGLINAPGQLLLRQLAQVDNRGGEISSARAFELLADNLDNRGGKLLSEQALTLRIARALDNSVGGRLAAPLIDLHSTALINNAGVLAATQRLDLQAESLDNRQGEVRAAHLNARLGQLDNRQGLLQVEQDAELQLTTHLDNRNGTLQAGGPLTLDAGSLDNSAGQLTSDAGLRARIAAGLLNRGGLLAAGAQLQLSAGSLDNQAQGRLLGKAGLSLSGEYLDNRAGRLLSGNALTLVLGQVDNRGGMVSAEAGIELLGQRLDNSASGLFEGKGPLRLELAELSNAQAGRVTSGATLSLIGVNLDNRNGGRVTSQGALLAELIGLDQRGGGQLLSDTALTIDMRGARLDNRQGLIHTAGQLLLRQLGEVDNRAGEISSARSFELVAQRLDNGGGQLISDEALLIRVAQQLRNTQGLVQADQLQVVAGTLDNQHGTLGAGQRLDLQVAAEVDNRGGELSSSGQTQVRAASLDNQDGAVLGDDSTTLTLSDALDNRGGTLAAGKALQVESAGLDNSAQGSLVSDGSLHVRSTGLFDNQAGELRARGLIDLALGRLDNRGGVVSGKQLLSLQANSVDNQAGLLHADSLLQLLVDRFDNRQGVTRSKDRLDYQGSALDNREGLLSASGPLDLRLAQVDNSKGRIATRGNLDASVATLQQQGGELIAEGRLTLHGDNADNRSGGLIAGNTGLDLQVGMLDNRGGQLSSLAQATLGGTQLDNSDGGKLIAGTRLALTVERLLNRNTALVFAQQIELRAARVDNQGGSIAAGQALRLVLDNSGVPLTEALLDNRGGRLDSAGRLILEGGQLLNQAGQLSSHGELSLTGIQALDNRGGTIETDAALTLASASLDNRDHGRITAEGDNRLSSGALSNGQGGLISSGQLLQVRAGQVGNQAGTLAGRQVQASVSGLDQHGGELFSLDGLHLDLNGGVLDNSAGLIRGPGSLLLHHLGQVDNRDGEISSLVDFELAADGLDNTGGKLLSGASLTLRIARQMDNLRGLVSARSLQLQAAGLDNGAGLISSRGDLQVQVDGLLGNAAGTLQADGKLLLVAGSVFNGKGQLSARSGLQARLGSLDNQAGQIASDTTLNLQADTLDNRDKGLLAAKSLLTVRSAAFDNRAGEVSGQGEVRLSGQRLDNGAGLILAKGALVIEQHTLLNAMGLVSSVGPLTLTGMRLENASGTLRSGADLSVELDDGLLNQNGRLDSDGTLSVSAASIDNNHGVLSSAGDLLLRSQGTLGNAGGQILGDAGLELSAAHLDNRDAGTVSAKGLLSISAASVDNLSGARLSSADRLRIEATQLDNSGGRITSQQALQANLGSLRQHGGTLYSASGVAIDLAGGTLDNQGGLINTPGQLLLTRLGRVDNRGGEISSANAFTLAAAELDNGNGRLLGNQGLNLIVARSLANLKGQIAAASLSVSAASLDNGAGLLTSRGDLQLDVAGQLANQGGGLLNAGRALVLNSASLANQGGQLLARERLTLVTGQLDNGNKGLINSQAGLDLTATDVNNDGGELSAGAALQIKARQFSQQGGRLLGDSTLALLLGLDGGGLNNRDGLIRAKGALTLANLRDLDNQRGEIASDLGFDLAARTLNNDGGRLISAQRLGVGSGVLSNQGGLVSGWQGLSVSADSLDNRNLGTLSSRAGDLDLSVTSNLDNSSGGALVSQGALRLNAAALDNRSGYLASGGLQRLHLLGALDNRQGRIDAGGDLLIQAASLDNRSANVISQSLLSLDLASLLNNAQGQLLATSALQVLGNATLLNQGGQLASQGTLQLAGSRLDNSAQGTLAANGAVAVTLADTLANDQDGLISSRDASVSLQAASLTNQGGAVQAGQALDVRLQQVLDNQRGKLIAQQGPLALSASSTDNRGGVLASLHGLLQAQVAGLLRNDQGGTLQASQLNLVALGGLNNQGGRLAAQAGPLVIRTQQLDNRNGGLYGQGQVTLEATALDNSAGGKLAGQALDLTLGGALYNRAGIIESDSRLGLVAATLDNQGGQLRSLGGAQSRLQVTGLLDNRTGALEIGSQDFNLQAGTFLNQQGRLLHGGSGDLQIGMANLSNAGGDIATLGGLTLEAASWTNSSVLQAARLTLNVGELTQTASGQLLATQRLSGSGGNWLNDGRIISDGSLDLHLGGRYAGNGRIASLGQLGIDAGQLELGVTGSIAGGDNTRIAVAGQVSNQGRLTSARNFEMLAGSMTNVGTLAASQDLTVVSQDLRNVQAADGSRGFMFSGQNMRLQVGAFSNEYADVYSLGNLLVGGVTGGTRANSVLNSSASIEAAGDIDLQAASVINKREKFRSDTQVTSGSISIYCVQHCGRPGGKWVRGPAFISQTVSTVVHEDSPMAMLMAGRNLTIASTALNNEFSLISAVNDLAIDSANISNVAGGSASGTDRHQIGKDVKIAGRYFYEMIDAVAAYDQAHPQSGPFDPVAFKALVDKFDPGVFIGIDDKIKVEGGAPVAPAIIQAGGKARLTASNDISNIVVQNTASSISQRSSDTTVSGATQPTIVTIHQQLPPDLAQQQVNPLSLPGFSLPTGQNGLFRLSAQAANQAKASATSSVPTQWQLGSASIDLQQRQQPTPLVQGRSVDLAELAAVAGSDRALQAHQRQAAGLDPGATNVRVAAIDQAQGPGALPSRSGEVAASQGTSSQVGGAADGLHWSTAQPGPSTPITLAQPSTETIAARDTSLPAMTSVAAPTLQQALPTVASTVSTAMTLPAAQSIPRVQGVPANTGTPQPHKYLIETNPVLTDLKQFMSSDYLLGNLGYDPDQSWKRLGDGFYEQRLIQQAVVARTGQQFIDGQADGEALYRHLMDNALTSKNQLDLQVGVSLSAEQVAALTHDIVWLEQHEVMGEQVLVPVLYLAHANNRLAPNGALIAGNDLTLVAGQNLDNSGTLRASNNLSASAGHDLDNSGLIEAGSRLDLLAGNRIVNGAGGLISGRDVSLTSLSGDVVNERSVSSHASGAGAYSKRADFVDSAARIEAANDLSIHAGRDLINSGGVLSAGADLDIRTGRDLLITSAQQVDSTQIGSNYRTQTTQQYGSQVTAGGDLALSAGRDFTAIASTLEAGRNVAVDALENLTLASAANESNFYSKTKKVTRQEDHVSQVGTLVKAGGDVALTAGKDLTLISSRVSAGDEAYLYAREQLSLLAETDSDYSLYDKKSKGSFGSKKTKRDEVTDVRHVGSEVSAAGAVTLASGGDQRYQAAKLESGEDLTLASGGAITFEGVKDLHQESHEKSKSSLAWNSAKGKGSTDETLRQTLMVTQGELAIRAAGKINIDIKQIDQNTVSQTIDAMVRAEPQLAWIKQAEASGQVDWRVVKEIHDSWDYKNSGLGAAPALIISIVASVYLGPLAGAMASNFAVGTINGGGDIGAGLKAATSSKAIKGYATQMVTSGILSGIDTAVAGWNPDGPLVLSASGINNPGYSSGMLDWNSVSQNILRSSTHALVAGSVNTAINGGSFKDNLGAAAVSEGLDLAAAFGNKQVGDLADYLNVSPGSAQKILMHAVLGGALSSAKGGDFKTGALAGAAAQGLTAATSAGLGKYLDSRFATDDQFKVATAQIIGVLAGALGNGNPETASWVAGNAQRYNDFLHPGGSWGAEAASLGAYMAEQGKTPEQISDALQSLARSDGYKGPGHDYVAGWVYTPAVLGATISPPAGLAGAAMGGVIGGGANISYQLSTDKPFSYVDAAIATTVGGATQGRGVAFTIGAGTGGAFLGSLIKGDSPIYPVLGAAIGGAVGLKSGQVVTDKLKPYLGSYSEIVGASLGAQISEATGGKIGSIGDSK
ncbi:filamentous hemagglutinin N-terminal domain-containing protein [Pseudomonas sp. MNR3A]|uniref:two-partner secretion domain-containing protein n=1 Tax=Pseudomonas sp. MNR3A TaxID=2615213 RepID=UPI00129A8AFA|nr:filamentous hemagglutinin N-terminal domain-containing protein [Pseudomonas sp. MNR3A]